MEHYAGIDVSLVRSQPLWFLPSLAAKLIDSGVSENALGFGS
jgi:hypothetical protein